MKIAILGWGSLYWDPRSLATVGPWFHDGPNLPIEFARISSNNRLTLVIKPGFPDVQALYIQSSNETLEAARENLRSRENTPNIENIGFVDFVNGSQHVRPSNVLIIPILNAWSVTRDFDAMIWSDFSPRFTDAIQRPFNLQNVIDYLNQLPQSEKNDALTYICNAPQQISTRFRPGIEQHFNNLL